MSSSIFNMPSSSSSMSPKIHFTHSITSTKYLDPSQPPTKVTPFRQIENVPFVRNLEVCMPKRLWKHLYEDGTDSFLPVNEARLPLELKYAKVNMTLGSVLDDENLRTGNYSLLSASSSPLSNSTNISLTSGKLKIDMPQHIYQRSGLTSPVIRVPSGGRKHDSKSARYRIEMDLRQPSMVKGKKSFDRLMHAAKTVEGLKEPRVWLFCDLSDTHPTSNSTGKKRKRSDENQRSSEDRKATQSTVNVTPTSQTEPDTNQKNNEHALSRHNPIIISTHGETGALTQVLIPSFLTETNFFSSLPTRLASATSQKANLPIILEDDIHDIIEYLSLLFLQSPRITKPDYGKIDSYLCQYTLPDTAPPPSRNLQSDATANESNDAPDGATASTVDDIYTFSYSGFMTSAFITQLLIDIIRRSRSTRRAQIPLDAWVAINFTAHKTDVRGGTDGCMILLQPGGCGEKDSSELFEEDGEIGRDATILGTEGDDLGDPGKEKGDPAGELARGFRRVTCFEFVDSLHS